MHSRALASAAPSGGVGTKKFYIRNFLKLFLGSARKADRIPECEGGRPLPGRMPPNTELLHNQETTSQEVPLIRIGKKKVPFIKNRNKDINEHADIHEHEIFQPTLFTFSAVKFPGLN